ncbi:helix-turn-helix domain-containing protein [Longispora albida]|uniref:helix-turn-helix domain-containing protein n=1 Tax=Longispora albida TaxID=203523 RepID=UPI000378628D|nr:helix-turn-helix domain-containing protein [Longispora albida]
MAMTLKQTAEELSRAAADPDSTARAALAGLVGLAEIAPSDGAQLVFRDGRSVELLPDMVDLLHHAARALTRGEGLYFGVLARELTTSAAAEILDVSRPTLVGLLDDGKIPSRKVGTHRRVMLKDVLDYKARQHKERVEAYVEFMTYMDDHGFDED